MKRNLKRIVAGVLAALMLVASVWAVPTSVTVVEEAGISAENDDIAAKLMDISGDGSEEDPFLIETEEDLMLVSDFPDCHFKLANDIALACEDWEPLCVLTDAFSGTFDGNGHTISNLTIKKVRSSGYNGLFARNAGTIKNLNVVTSEMGITGYAAYVGVLVAQNSGTIENCRVSGNINLMYSDDRNVNIGGAVGLNDTSGNIENCYSDVYIFSDAGSYNSGDRRNIGGLVGYNSGKITKSFFAGNIDLSGYYYNGYYYPRYYYAGGLVGYGYGTSSTVTESAAITSILNSDGKGSYSYVSGLVGYCSTNCNISNSYAVVDGTQLDYGLTCNATVTNSFYDKGVSGLTDTSYGTPKTTAAMKMAATYTKAGWDFENTWAISKNINGGYPYLQWMYQKNEDYTPAFDDSMQAYLNLDELISMSVCYKFDNMAVVNAEAYLDSVGLLVWNADEVPEEATIDDCDNIIAGAYYNSVLDRFETTTNGIAPKKLGDGLAFRAYYVDEDGNYTYSRLITDYCPKTYCYNRINNSDSTETVELMASILNYGAAAQKYLGYKADDLMNKDLPDELKIMVVE